MIDLGAFSTEAEGAGFRCTGQAISAAALVFALAFPFSFTSNSCDPHSALWVIFSSPLPILPDKPSFHRSVRGMVHVWGFVCIRMNGRGLKLCRHDLSAISAPMSISGASALFGASKEEPGGGGTTPPQRATRTAIRLWAGCFVLREYTINAGLHEISRAAALLKWYRDPHWGYPAPYHCCPKA